MDLSAAPWDVLVVADLADWRDQQRGLQLLSLCRPYAPGPVFSVRELLPRLPLDVRRQAVALFCDSMEYARRRAGMPAQPADRETIEREAGLRL